MKIAFYESQKAKNFLQKQSSGDVPCKRSF